MSDQIKSPHPDEIHEWYERWVYSKYCNDKEANAFEAGVNIGFIQGYKLARDGLDDKEKPRQGG